VSTSANCWTSAEGIVFSTCNGQPGGLAGRMFEVIGLTVADGAGISNA
jgi:hypothetical protein